MKCNNYSAPAIEQVSFVEAWMLADSFSNVEPIVGPMGAEEDLYYEF